MWDLRSHSSGRTRSVAVAALLSVSWLAGASAPAAHSQTPGSLDLTFDPGAGADKPVAAVAAQGDGKIVLGGDFKTFNGVTRGRVARLNADGSVDPTFDPGAGADGAVSSIALQSDGKIVVGGAFTTFNATPANHVARLNADGSLDGSFNVGSGANDAVIGVTVQADGKIVLGGAFNTVNGAPANHVARLNADGTVDAAFLSALGQNDGVDCLGVGGDGKIVVGGGLSIPSRSENGDTTLGRLNADGSVDTTFQPAPASYLEGTFGFVNCVTVQSDGTIIFGAGTVFFFRGDTSVSHVVELLNADSADAGSLPIDADFDIGCVAVAGDGEIIVGGGGLLRFTADGIGDSTFNGGLGPYGLVNAVAVQPDGKLVVVGDFTSYDGVARSYVARVNGGHAAAGTVNLAVGGSGEVVKDGAKGIVLATRDGGGTSEPLTVFYKVKGTAMPGVDYKALSGRVTIPAGSATAKFKIKPIAGSPNHGRRKVKVVLLPPADGSYTVGTSPVKIKLVGK